MEWKKTFNENEQYKASLYFFGAPNTKFGGSKTVVDGKVKFDGNTPNPTSSMTRTQSKSALIYENFVEYNKSALRAIIDSNVQRSFE